VELRADRADAIARPLDVDQIEVGVQKGIDMITEEVQRVSSQMDNLGADEANLGSKIEKKTMDLERNNKRLRALESVRPAFMDEYEKLEADLQVQYEVSVRLCWSREARQPPWLCPSFATQQQHPQLLTGLVGGNEPGHRPHCRCISIGSGTLGTWITSWRNSTARSRISLSRPSRR